MPPAAVLVVVPVRLDAPERLTPLLRCLVALRATAPAADILVVDAGTPRAALASATASAAAEAGARFEQPRSAYNVVAAADHGLREARERGIDAAVVAADVELRSPDWVTLARGRTDAAGRPAALVGARVVLREGLIAHAGLQFSLLKRRFATRYLFGPAELPEALRPAVCPLAGGFVYAPAATLQAIGALDPGYDDAGALLDYSLRVFAAGRSCVYEPAILAVRHRPPAAVRDVAGPESLERISRRHAGQDFGPFVPAVRG